MDINGTSKRQKTQHLSSTTDPPATYIDGVLGVNAINDISETSSITLAPTSVSVSSSSFTFNNDDVQTQNSVFTVANSSTGVITGGIMTINGTTNIDISDGSGEIVNPDTEVRTSVEWTGLSNLTPTSSGVITYVCINASGNPTYFTSKPSNEDTRDYICLGTILHSSLPTLDAVDNEQLFVANPLNTTRDLYDALGFINKSGNELGSTSLLTISKSEGIMIKFGANYYNNPKDPHNLTLYALDTSTAPDTFKYMMQNGTTSAALSNIIPNIEDDGSNYPGTTYGSNRWGIQRVYVFPSNIMEIMPSQNDYATEDLAISSINDGTHQVELSLKDDAMLIGYIVVKGNASDLSDPTEAKFINAGKLSGISEAGSASADIQSVYNNSTNPEMFTDNTRGALTIRRGSALETDNVLEIQSNDGTTNFSVDGNGDMVSNNISSITDEGVGSGRPTITGTGALVLRGTYASVNGPHIYAYSDLNDYPLIGVHNFAHDSQSILFDTYYDGAFKSADAGSNFAITKNLDKLRLQYDGPVAEAGLITFNDGLTMDTAGVVTVPGSISCDQYNAGGAIDMTIGGFNEKTIYISRTSQTTNINGNLQVNVDANVTGNLTCDNIDSSSVNALDIGGTTSSSVNISQLNDVTTIKGHLQVDQDLDINANVDIGGLLQSVRSAGLLMEGDISVNVGTPSVGTTVNPFLSVSSTSVRANTINRLTAGTIAIGDSTTTGLDLSKTGDTTAVKGDLIVDQTSVFTGDVSVNSVTDSTSSISGSIQTDGGLGVVKDVFIGGQLNCDTISSGTWTPSLTFTTGSLTFTTQVGEWQQIGKLLFITTRLCWSGSSSPTGNMQYSLPFQINSSRVAFNIGYIRGITLTSQLTITGTTGNSYCSGYETVSGGTPSILQGTSFPNVSGCLYISGVYVRS